VALLEDTVGLNKASNQWLAPAIFIFFGYLLTLGTVLPQLLESYIYRPKGLKIFIRHTPQNEDIISKKLLNPLLQTETFPCFPAFFRFQDHQIQNYPSPFLLGWNDFFRKVGLVDAFYIGGGFKHY